MSISAIIMMVIGCGGLWGGCAFSCYLSYKYSKKQKEELAETTDEK